MARPQQRYRGVRQRHWGSWVSEIRHPLLKTRIWLGTFESAEDAAKAYDEAARIMGGPRARTNFAYSAASARQLSATLLAKLQKCHVASLKMIAKKPPQQCSGKPATAAASSDSDRNGLNHNTQQELKPTRDDDDLIEQMIQELLDYGSIELSAV